MHAVDPRPTRSAWRTSTPPTCRSRPGFFGTLVDHTGVFAEAERFAAAAQGADRTMFSVHGSSGSNWIVLRMLALERQDALVLVARNIHHSVINALKAFGLDFRFLPTPYEPRFEALLPPSVDEVLEGLRATPRRWRSSTRARPTRGWRRTRARSRAPCTSVAEHAMVIVDEAWGGHLHFHPDLPPSGDGRGRRRLRAVDAQARRRPAADGADPLARGRAWTPS